MLDPTIFGPPKKKCKHSTCNQEAERGLYCGPHYQRKRLHKPMDPPVIRKKKNKGKLCQANSECSRPAHTMTYCATHYHRWLRRGELKNWAAPLKELGGGQAPNVHISLSEWAKDLVKEEADKLGVSQKRMLRIIVESWAKRMREKKDALKVTRETWNVRQR